MVCVLSSCHAQAPPQRIEPLKIGDTVPNVLLNNIINYPQKEIKLYDLKGKLVILDFFATWCSNCVAALPKLDSLQRQFDDSIQIFVVDYEPTPKIMSFVRSSSIAKKVSLPIITSDSVLRILFPHRLLPHEVWITPDGILRATTSSDQVNTTNIKKLLAGKHTHLRVKSDIMNFDHQQLLFFNNNVNINPKNLKYYSIFSGHINGIPSSSFIKRDTNNLITRVCLTNFPIKQLYQFAFNIHWPDNRWILQIASPASIKLTGIVRDHTAWAIHHTYCYELLTPPTSLEKIRQKMQQDLEDYFGYYAEIENRKMKCLVLTANTEAKIPISQGGNAKHNFSNNKTPKFISNQPISILINYLNYTLPIPVLNETNFSSPIDVQLPKDLSNIDSLKYTLHKYGFDLEESEKMIDVFVLSDK